MDFSHSAYSPPAPVPAVSLRLLRLADRFADAMGFLSRPLVADEIVAEAQRRTGLTDFGDWPFLAPLRILLQACEREASLGTFGRFAMRWDTLRFLSNLLTFRADEKLVPVASLPIEQPIFVTGLPRSGTSFLHSLLAEDPANAVPRCWQTIHPSVPADEAERQRWIRKVDRQLRAFRWLAPEVRYLHPMAAGTPQECGEITAHVFASLRFDTTHHVPSYREWLDQAGHLDAYRFHRRFLQHLRRQGTNGRWVLKCPDHVFALDAIRAVYPDARFVFVHRDPLHVLPSVARLTEVLRQPFTRRLDRAAIGRQICDRWADGAARILAASETIPPDLMLHVRHQDLVADPVGTVAQLYRQFGLSFDEALQVRIAAYVAAKPNGGYGRNAYRPEEYGIDMDVERHRYADYMAHFAIQPEPASRRAWKLSRRYQ